MSGHAGIASVRTLQDESGEDNDWPPRLAHDSGLVTTAATAGSGYHETGPKRHKHKFFQRCFTSKIMTTNTLARPTIVLPSDQDATGRTLGPREIELVTEVIRSGTLTSTKGTFVSRLESEFAQL